MALTASRTEIYVTRKRTDPKTGALLSLATVKVEHEIRADGYHRLHVDGRPGPWASEAQLAVGADFRATTEYWANILPRVFLPVDVEELRAP